MKIFAVALIHSFALLCASGIENYVVQNFCIADKDGSEIAIIRSFLKNGKKWQLEVNTKTLKTSISPATDKPRKACSGSRYMKLVEQSSQTPHPIQNDGIISGGKGIAVTTDLCPSSKAGFEYRLYIKLAQISPAPSVTVFITGKWIEQHTAGFQKLREFQKDRKLDIVWGNHTYSHPYKAKNPLKHNFSLTEGYDLKKDTLKLEKLLIQKGLTPSIWFRFPGLVSDSISIDMISSLGLVTIGSDTWIAKGQKIKRGSIILLHGNKNEPKGVDMFLKALKTIKIDSIKALRQML